MQCAAQDGTTPNRFGSDPCTAKTTGSGHCLSLLHVRRRSYGAGGARTSWERTAGSSAMGINLPARKKTKLVAVVGTGTGKF